MLAKAPIAQKMDFALSLPTQDVEGRGYFWKVADYSALLDLQGSAWTTAEYR